jgi:SAM-dependent methyltransferase
MNTRTFIKALIPKGIKKVVREYVASVAERQIEQQTIKNEDAGVYMQQALSLLQLKNVIPPLPPSHLQVRVSNRYYGEFFTHGNAIIGDIEQVLSTAERGLMSFEKILDFGCGCGRTLIPLSFRIQPERLYGTDIDEEAIAWLRSHYSSFADLSVNPVMPPTGYADNMFDFIYCISIFTHLPEDMQIAWLDELRRIVAQGGYVVVSTHGEHAYSYFSSDFHKEFYKKGFYYFEGAEKTEGLPPFYKAAFHSPEYIKKVWSKYFKVVSLKSRGLSEHQDLILLQKQESSF